MNKTKIKIIKATIIQGTEAYPDFVFEVDNKIANQLILTGKAVKYVEPAKSKKTKKAKKAKKDK